MSSKKTALKQVQVTISALTHDSNGIGPYVDENGREHDVEVPFTAVGDTALVLLHKKRRGRYQGRLLEVIEPSAERVEPRCPHFSKCGGCRLQHLRYSKQLEIKEQEVRRAFSELLEPHVQFLPILPCDPPWHYRNKMEFSFSSDISKNKFLGLILDSSRGKVFNLEQCHLVAPWFAETVVAVRQWWEKVDLDGYRPVSNSDSLRTLTLREGQRTGDRMVVLTVSGNPDYALKKEQLDGFVQTIRAAAEPKKSGSKMSIFLRIQQIAKGMPTNFYEMLLYGQDHIREVLQLDLGMNIPPFNLTFQISPSAFFQPNTVQSEKIYSLALQMAQLDNNAFVYDLYCGIGTIGICLAKYVKEVVAIEMSPESILDARQNALNNGLKNISFHSGAVRHMLQHVHDTLHHSMPDLVVVDPPRPGLDFEVMEQLLSLGTPKIIYISCNVKTQVENIKMFIAAGYRLSKIQPVDQFPHTAHIENIVFMERSCP